MAADDLLEGAIMSQPARRIQPSLVMEEYGRVIDVHDRGFLVQTGSGCFAARRALSCLIEPRLEDKVLVCQSDDSESFILAILERTGDQHSELRLPGDLTVGLPEGALRLIAGKGIEAASAGSIEAVAPRIKLSGDQGEIYFRQLYYWGQLIHAVTERIKSTAQVVESVMDRLTQTVQTSYRTITESEHVKAGSLYYSVRRLFSLRGKYTVITAKEDVKIDGRHIHMG
jgi:hypothetical protein